MCRLNIHSPNGDTPSLINVLLNSFYLSLQSDFGSIIFLKLYLRIVGSQISKFVSFITLKRCAVVDIVLR